MVPAACFRIGTPVLMEVEAKWAPQSDWSGAYNVTLRRFRGSLLPWKSNAYYIFLCVCAHARVCVCARVALRIHHAKRRRR
jgi:hypothetical protein